MKKVNLITENLAIWTAAQTQKTNGGRRRGKNSNGQTAHGIKKLRELILELAVRGKLVPQDPNDEPASVLLEKVAKEKARLIKEGKIKKRKRMQIQKLSLLKQMDLPHMDLDQVQRKKLLQILLQQSRLRLMLR